MKSASSSALSGGNDPRINAVDERGTEDEHSASAAQPPSCVALILRNTLSRHPPQPCYNACPSSPPWPSLTLQTRLDMSSSITASKQPRLARYCPSEITTSQRDTVITSPTNSLRTGFPPSLLGFQRLWLSGRQPNQITTAITSKRLSSARKLRKRDGRSGRRSAATEIPRISSDYRMFSSHLRNGRKQNSQRQRHDCSP